MGRLIQQIPRAVYIVLGIVLVITAVLIILAYGARPSFK